MSSQSFNLRESIAVFLKGFAMGAANVVPGVSGGTVAFVTGIYERLINALKSFDLAALRLFLNGQFRAFAKHVDLWFLCVLMVGAVCSVLTLAKLLEVGFAQYPVYVASLFFGLILASVPAVAKLIKAWSVSTWLALFIGLCIAVGLAFLPRASESTQLVYLMLCGVVAMCSMIIPGVSGSFVLLLMGNYQLIMIDSVNDLRLGNWDTALPVLVPVAVGAVLGLIVLSRFLSWLFKRHHDNAVAVITGFVAGSLVIIWPWKSKGDVILKNGEEKVLSYVNELPALDTNFFIAFCIILAGIVLMVTVEKIGMSRDQ